VTEDGKVSWAREPVEDKRLSSAPVRMAARVGIRRRISPRTDLVFAGTRNVYGSGGGVSRSQRRARIHRRQRGPIAIPRWSRAAAILDAFDPVTGRKNLDVSIQVRAARIDSGDGGPIWILGATPRILFRRWMRRPARNCGVISGRGASADSSILTRSAGGNISRRHRLRVRSRVAPWRGRCGRKGTFRGRDRTADRIALPEGAK